MTRINVILAILAVVLAIPVVWHVLQEGQRFTVWSEEPLLFDGLDPKDVALIGYGRPTGDPVGADGAVPRDRIVFRRSEGQWVLHEGDLQGVPALGDQVEATLIEFVRPIRRREANVVVRDASPQQLDAYGVSRKTARVVSLQRGDQTQLATLYVGNYVDEASSSRGLAGYYVRNSTDTDILFYERPRWELTTDPSAWVDRAVHRLESGEIASLAYMGPRTKGQWIRFSRDPKPGLWKVEELPKGARDIRHSDVTNLVARYADIRAERILGPSSMAGGDNAIKMGLGSPWVAVEATMEDGAVHRLTVGNNVSRSPNRYAVGGDGQWLVVLPPHTWDGFERDPLETLFTRQL